MTFDSRHGGGPGEPLSCATIPHQVVMLVPEHAGGMVIDSGDFAV
ncbi:hypothetical protein [Streptomyces sp. B1-3]